MNKTRMKKTVILLTTLMMIFLSACGSNGENDEKASTSNEGEVIQVGFFDCDMMVAAPVAYHSGMYEAAGLNVELTMTGQIGVLMAAGQMDVGYMGTNAVNNALNQGTRIKMTAFNHLGGSYYMVGSNELATAKDAVGKRINMGPDAHDVNPEWRIIAHEAGIPYDPAEYDIYSMSQRDAYFAFTIGELDAIMVCDPWCSLAEYEGIGHELAVSRKLVDGDWGFKTMLIMTEDFLEERREEAEKMQLVHAEAIKYLYTNPVESAKIFSDVFEVPEEVGMRTIYRKTVGEGRTMSWEICQESVERYYDMAQDYFDMGEWQESVSPDIWVYHELLQSLDVDDFETFIREEVDPIYPEGMSFEEWMAKAYQLYES